MHKTLSLFQDFHTNFPFLDTEQLIEYFSFFGGVHDNISLDFFEDIDTNISAQIIDRFAQSEQLVAPEYLLDAAHQKFLTAIARGDGKLLSAFRRARVSEAAGREMLDELIRLGVVMIEESRESPLREHPKQAIKKSLRGYRIQSKVRFVQPFYRFWFGFVVPFSEKLRRGEGEPFMENYRLHRDRAISLVFEQLSNELLKLHFAQSDPIINSGSFWDHISEYDLLSVTRSGKIILGECKYTGRSICKGELTKLKEKALSSGIRVDVFAFFSRSGFSRELRENCPEDVILFELEDYARLLVGR